jgi:hypothetical protein
MKPIYPYFEVKYAVDTFVETYGEKMTKDKWSITSKPCKKCDETFDSNIRNTDERFFYKTTTGKIKKNEDYLFVERQEGGKLTKGIYQQLLNYGFEIDKNGLILDFKKNVTINPNNESSHSGDEILYSGI